MIDIIKKIIDTPKKFIIKIYGVVVSLISCFYHKRIFNIKSIHIYLIVLIILINYNLIFANSNIIYPNTSHLYHGNVAQSRLKDQFVNINSYDSIIFGRYDQDSDILNGKEPVEWMVLENDTNNREAILLSKYILECIRFNGFSEPVAWDRSSLRKYLNEELIYEIFDSDEIKCILDTHNTNSVNIYNDTYSGEDTIDKLFIPSIDDMYKYFTDANLSVYERYQELLKPNIYRVSLSTPHAINNGVRIMGAGNKYPTSGNYFLRTSAPIVERIWYKDVIEKNFISFVSEVGQVMPYGTGISSSDDGIRLMLKVRY